jgi:hypothetical protein
MKDPPCELEPEIGRLAGTESSIRERFEALPPLEDDIDNWLRHEAGAIA